MFRGRARGCLLGQLVGDALGAQVEFQTPHEIRQRYPEGVRMMEGGGVWGTLAGQPTDDSEMAIMLARALLEHGTWNGEAVLRGYNFWFATLPFDCGRTVANALGGGIMDPDSQANGALTRVSPLGIFGAGRPLPVVGDWARRDALLTHVHPVCLQINSLFVCAIARAISSGCSAADLYAQVREWAETGSVEVFGDEAGAGAGASCVDPAVLSAVKGAADSPPADFMSNMGWVLTAFRNALHQLVNASSFEEAIVDTIGRGGDTDTNAAVCGALLGAVHGFDAIPADWVSRVLSCRPAEGVPGVFHPRPEVLWPVDALELADGLLERQSAGSAQILV